MTLFTDAQQRDIREYVFNMEPDKRSKILQCVEILRADGEDDEALTATMYQMASSKNELDRIYKSLTNSSLVTGDAFEAEIKQNRKDG